ncbi:MAG: hypothetical protein MJ098_04900 [Saccharofermentans sp.]|nr:hypothetical protein [Saccharofermentans sp.]
MGRGGGGGGSHHSSHHSSSHSHSGGGSSYHSSRSSYSHSSRSYGSSGGYSGGSHRSGGGCGSVFGSIIAIIIIISFIGLFIAALEGSANGNIPLFIERSTVNREPLPDSKCTPYEEWYQDDWGDWIDDYGEENSLIHGLRYFYEKTGVQPYLWIMGEEGKDFKYEESLEELSDIKYKELFGDDEGHLIVIFREYPNASSNYICTATPGYDAEVQVMDKQAREILLDYIDYYYTDNNLTEGQFFDQAFCQAANRMMKKQLSWKQIGVIVAVAIILVIGIIITAKIVKSRKVAVAKQKAAQARAEATQAQAVATQKQVDFNRKQYEDQLETQNVAVTCPNCGATNIKIRKHTVGHCDFCGSAIRVDGSGNVTVRPGEQK